MRHPSFAVLAVTALVLLLAAPVEAQDIGASAYYEDIHLTSGFTPDPVTRSLTAGGSVRVEVTSSCSYGWVGRAPDYKLYYEAGDVFPLYIYATADRDITLLVNRPDGSWVCNDDGHTGLNPLLSFSSPQSGRYDIWVGTYGDETAPATLYISELAP